jgi:hypothetical protein
MRRRTPRLCRERLAVHDLQRRYTADNYSPCQGAAAAPASNQQHRPIVYLEQGEHDVRTLRHDVVLPVELERRYERVGVLDWASGAMCPDRRSDAVYMSATTASVVVLYPDFLGDGLACGGFADRLRAEHDLVVALVNGPDPGALRPSSRSDVTVVVSPVSGLAPSLRHGYRAAASLGDVVVRIDTAENPTERIKELAAAAVVHGGAIGDLCFGDGTLRPGSADEHSQLDVFPEMFRRFTDGRLALTGTHGFQAWRSDVLADVVPVAEELWDAAASLGPMRWAFDAAMALAADLVGNTPTVIQYPAFELRDRDRTKIAEQHDAVLRVLLTYLRRRESWS